MTKIQSQILTHVRTHAKAHRTSNTAWGRVTRMSDTRLRTIVGGRTVPGNAVKAVRQYLREQQQAAA